MRIICNNNGIISEVLCDNDTTGSIPALPISYDDLVEQKIRQRYTISAEFAVLRQRDEKPAEYADYYAFCESCKAEAKAELGIQ